MKQFLDFEKTQNLIFLGYPKPQQPNYSIGELLSFVEKKSYIWQLTKNSEKVQVVCFFNKQGDGCSYKEEELIDSLYYVCIHKIGNNVLSKEN